MSTNVVNLDGKRALKKVATTQRSSRRQAALSGSGIRLPVPTEADVRCAVRDYLRLRGWFVYHNMGGPLSYKGLSDLTIVKGGRVVWVELKRPGGRQSSDQAEFQRDLEAAGGEYLLVTGVNDVMKWEKAT